ncbi:MAG TPA: hypothetical protein VF458_14190 [Ktedonobacteraceae bacterium]
MTPETRRRSSFRWRIAGIAAVLSLALSLLALPLHAQSNSGDNNPCQLGNGVQHVIYLQFDNVHFTRDNPNIPSDLEQMPNLLNFIENNGTLLSNHHTPLIAHTATDILTSLTGVYGDQHGVPISNSFRYFNPNGTTNPGVSFAYWTDPIFDPSTSAPSDTTFNMLTAQGKNAPAPWVPYTRAGCNFGAVATANTILENIATDIPTVFGANSPQAQEVQQNPTLATADFVGIGVHCALNNALCSTANGGVSDRLPDEPGGYNGYNALLGHKYVAPQISPSGPLTDLNGNVIQDSRGNAGFPGFDGMSAAVSLSYVAALQEHNVPVTYAYLSDAHDNHAGAGAYGPGQAGYVAALKSYDDAFGAFFKRLNDDGINAHNTLFVVTADEGDHFVGGAPSPANCDGITVPCTYSQIGELTANLTGLLATQQGITTPFTVHSDSAPNIYLTGNPARDAATTRAFEQALAQITTTNPLTGQTEQLANYLVDPVEMNLLHMITADPARTPTLTMFAKPDYFVQTGKPNCTAPCVFESPAFAWNHGDVGSDINVTWLGMVGPGVKELGVDHQVWSDHADIRPTIMELTGLRDDYQHEGRVLFEVLKTSALPIAVRQHEHQLIELAELFKQINAPVGDLGLATLAISTRALASNSTNDQTYTSLENQLLSITQTRNAIAGQILSLLETAEFGDSGAPHGFHANDSSINSLSDQGQSLLQQVQNLAS